jgi:antitoxin component of RelBE/YafQ-DinJ toxin-antitoxin module
MNTSNLSEIVNVRIDLHTKTQLTRQADQRQLKLAQLVRLALVEWLAVQRGLSMPVVQRRHDDKE